MNTQIFICLGALGLLALGAELLIRGSTSLARTFRLHEAIIGAVILGFGTSTPELATSLLAAARRAGDLSLGNVLGSNIFNICGIAGLAALISPIPLYSGMITRDLPAMLFLSVLVVPLSVSGQRLSRVEGGCLLAAYAALLHSLLR